MKRNKVKRLLATCLGMAMVLSSLTGCQSTENTNQAESDAGTSVEQEVGSSDAASGEGDKEPITLTIGIGAYYWSLSEGIHDEIPLFKACEEATGVKLEVVCFDGDKFSLMGTGGDMPDLVSMSGDATTFSSMIESGQFYELNDLIDQYGQNIKENIPDALTFSAAQFDGSIYYMPVGVNYVSETPITNAFCGLRARFDIYEEIGMPEITDEDSLLNVLKQMQDHQRAKTGENDIYAMSTWNDTWPYIIMYPFGHGTMNMAVNSGYFFDTGEVYNCLLTEDGVFWDGMNFFRKAYNMGILDPDGFTQGTQYGEKVASGKILTTYAWDEVDTEICGENAIMTFLPGMPYISGVYGQITPGGAQMVTSRAISKNCEYPERAMEVWNWLDSDEARRIAYNGLQGVHWDYVDGVPQYIGEMAEAAKNGGLQAFKDENYIIPATPYLSGNLVCEDGYLSNLATTEEFLANMSSPAEKHFAQAYDESFSYPGQVYDKWIKEGKVKSSTNDEWVIKYAFVANVSAEASAIDSEAMAYFYSRSPELIMAETEEEFNKIKKEVIDYCYDIGYDEVFAEFEAMLADSVAQAEEMFEFE